MTMLAFLLLLSLASLAFGSQLRVFHRVHHPVAENPSNFYYRGELINYPEPTLLPDDDHTEDFKHFSEFFESENFTLDDALYQVGFQVGDEHPDIWHVSSVKLCHLFQATSESLIVHAIEGSESEPYAIDYFVSPIPSGGACPTTKPGAPSPLLALAAKFPQLNTTVTVRNARLPPLPELRVPPPLSETGEPVKPPQEKSFIQKYWMYIVPVLIVLLMTGGSEEEGPRRSQ